MNKPKIILIIGQTASGKEKLSLKLAEHLSTQIISMDSMKLYKDMNIGTAKPPQEAQKRIKHHMIDIIEPTVSFTANEYYELVTNLIEEFRANQLIPYFSGGTALYAKILQDGMFSLPNIPNEIKAELEKSWDNGEHELLYEQLSKADPQAVTKIHSNDKLRIIRALEVYRFCGKPISELQLQFNQKKKSTNIKLIGIRRPRNELHQRIEQRVKWMIESGLIEEVESLLKKYTSLAKSPSMAVGYFEIIQYLKGDLSKEEAIERVIINTRQLCKHQMTWYRKFPVDWIEANNDSKDIQMFDQAKIKADSFLNE